MTNVFALQRISLRNEQQSSYSDLVGIAKGLICDGELNDREVTFLRDWLTKHESATIGWPGSVIRSRLHEVLADGLITDAERAYLIDTLQSLIGGTLEDLPESTHVTEFAFDSIEQFIFQGARFCLTGDFCFAPRDACHEAILRRGGSVSSSVTKKVHYVVVGSLGSTQWKHGSYGTKVDEAMRLKSEGAALRVVREDEWAASLSKHPPINS